MQERLNFSDFIVQVTLDSIGAQKNGSTLEGTWPFKKQPPIKLVL